MPNSKTSSLIGVLLAVGGPRALSAKFFSARVFRSKVPSRCYIKTSRTAMLASVAPGPNQGIHVPLNFARTAPRPRPGRSPQALGPDFFAAHTVTELESWPDHDLEEQGRLTQPMRYDPPPTSTGRSTGPRHSPRSAADLQALDRDPVVFYTSGGPRSRRPTCTRCSRGCTATTTCPTARTCATRAPRWRCREHRRPGRHGRPGRLRGDRLHFLLRAERRHEQPAHAAPAAGSAQARGADRHLQSAARARPGALHQPAVARRRC